jgi:hypothetical protein
MKNMRKALTKELPSCEAPAEGFRSPPGEPSPTPGCNKRGASEKHEAGTFRTQINKIKLQSIRKNE